MNVKIYVLTVVATGEQKFYGNMVRLTNDWDLKYDTVKKALRKKGFYVTEDLNIKRREILR